MRPALPPSASACKAEVARLRITFVIPDCTPPGRPAWFVVTLRNVSDSNGFPVCTTTAYAKDGQASSTGPSRSGSSAGSRVAHPSSAARSCASSGTSTIPPAIRPTSARGVGTGHHRQNTSRVTEGPTRRCRSDAGHGNHLQTRPRHACAAGTRRCFFSPRCLRPAADSSPATAPAPLRTGLGTASHTTTGQPLRSRQPSPTTATKPSKSSASTTEHSATEACATTGTDARRSAAATCRTTRFTASKSAMVSHSPTVKRLRCLLSYRPSGKGVRPDPDDGQQQTPFAVLAANQSKPSDPPG